MNYGRWSAKVLAASQVRALAEEAIAEFSAGLKGLEHGTPKYLIRQPPKPSLSTRSVHLQKVCILDEFYGEVDWH